jgi:hypothetical protein
MGNLLKDEMFGILGLKLITFIYLKFMRGFSAHRLDNKIKLRHYWYHLLTNDGI